MCALTVAPPISSPDLPDRSSWVVRTAKLRVEREEEARTVPLCFRDLYVSTKDLTTVKEAFAECSAEEMLQAVMRHEAGWRLPVDVIGSRAHHMLMGRIGAALDAMNALESAAVGLSPSREGVIGPLFRIASAGGGGGIEHKVGVAVLSTADTDAVREVLASGMERVCTWDELRTLRREAVSSPASERLAPAALAASGTVLSRMPWERVLALPLWLPSDLSEEERRAVLAKVFWSMTYRGFTQEGCSWQGEPDSWFSGEEGRVVRAEPALLPADPLMAVLDHNCWVDTLEAWEALFTAMRSSETRL